MCDENNDIIPDFFNWITEADVRNILIDKYMHGVEQAVAVARGLKPEDFPKLS